MGYFFIHTAVLKIEDPCPISPTPTIGESGALQTKKIMMIRGQIATAVVVYTWDSVCKMMTITSSCTSVSVALGMAECFEKHVVKLILVKVIVICNSPIIQLPRFCSALNLYHVKPMN